MKTLAEHNKKMKTDRWFGGKQELWAGVLCNICRREMVFSDETVMLSNPPQRNVECPNCKIKTRKIG